MQQTQKQELHKLNAKWTLTEKYNQQKTDYKASIVEACTFDSLEEFAFLLNNTPYGNLTELFSEVGRQKIYKHIDPNNQSDVQLEALQIFKNDIKPQWEDPQNSKGGEIKFEVRNEYIRVINDFFTSLLKYCVGQGDEYLQHVCIIIDQINGLRLLDKINQQGNNNQGHLRFELWLDINPTLKENDNIKREIENVIELIAKQYGLKELDFKYSSHK